jgi:hypothetical protein
MTTSAIYARLGGGPQGWLRLLADGWQFNDWIVAPMAGTHGHYAVLMVR